MGLDIVVITKKEEEQKEEAVRNESRTGRFL